MDKEVKHCMNTACGFHGVRVETEKADCIGCKRPLQTDSLGDLLDEVFGKRPGSSR